MGLLLSVQANAETLVADYQLQGTYASSVGSIGPLAVVGTATDVGFAYDQDVNGNFQTVVQFSFDGLMDPGGGLQAQTAGFLDPSNYSVVLTANFDLSPDLAATKLLDFKNLSSDDGLYVNDATGLLDFNGVAGATGGTPVVSGTYTQIALTRDSSDNLVTVYEDGTEAFQFTDSSDLAVLGDSVSPSSNAYLTVFKDDDTGPGSPFVNETSIGDLANLSLYNGALTASEIGNLGTVPTAAPLPSPFWGGVVLFAGIGIWRKLRRNWATE
jgi:hypothetical protein